MQPPTSAASTRRPWNPTTIAVLTLVLSPFAGGILHGINYGRLGQSGFRRFALARNLLAAMLVNVPLAAMKQRPFGIYLFFAAYFYKTQQEAFQSHLAKGGKKGSVFLAILVAILVFLPLAVLDVYFNFLQ